MKAGFNPYKVRFAPDMMEAAGLGSSYAEWRESAICGVLSRTDWNVCDTCMAQLKPYLDGPAAPASVKSSKPFSDAKTDPAASVMQAVLSQGRRSSYARFPVKRSLIAAGTVGAAVILAATLFFFTRNDKGEGVPAKNDLPSAKSEALDEGVTVQRTQSSTFQTEVGERKNRAVQPPGAVAAVRGGSVEAKAASQLLPGVLNLRDVCEQMRKKTLKEHYGCRVAEWRMRPDSAIKKYVELVKNEKEQFRFVETLLCEGEDGLLFALEDKPRKPLTESENNYAVFSRGSFEGTLAGVKTFDGKEAPVLKDWIVHFGDDSSSQRGP
ncbi:MAG: hypothetical protein ABSG68_21605 [Thermoguttaceae bacterium]